MARCSVILLLMLAGGVIMPRGGRYLKWINLAGTSVPTIPVDVHNAIGAGLIDYRCI